MFVVNLASTSIFFAINFIAIIPQVLRLSSPLAPVDGASGPCRSELLQTSQLNCLLDRTNAKEEEKEDSLRLKTT